MIQSRITKEEIDAMVIYLESMSTTMSIDDRELSPSQHAKAVKAYEAVRILRKSMDISK